MVFYKVPTLVVKYVARGNVYFSVLAESLVFFSIESDSQI